MINQWITVCNENDLFLDAGVCALVNGHQIALFLCGHNNSLYAINNYDPIGKANVLSRGIVGSLNGTVVVASPLYKQHFCLESGQCVERAETLVPTYPVRRYNGNVQVQLVVSLLGK
ncbi:Nitrite reductase (NADH) small subunit [Photobacterium andalusiense]|uniref:Nitrite reductase (NADH) small subunit n=1 Tax=Photobacterium andalusiense TaxID=2204296 RepID=A0A1Y6M5W0_9GAMM|nr:Nitrite reductase (NADH) small subunit [Photobacterium andalusiense]